MGNKTISNAIASIDAASELGAFMFQSIEGEPQKVFGLGPDTMLVRGNANVATFNTCVKAIYKAETKFASAITIKELENKIGRLIRDGKRSGKVDAQKLAETLVDEILKIPKQQWTIVRRLFGADLGKSDEIVFGPFTLFPSSNIQSRFLANIPLIQPVFENLCKEMGTVCISRIVESSTYARAQELADNDFEQFERIIAFMVGIRDNNMQVAVLNPRLRMTALSLSFSEGEMSTSSQLVGPMQNVSLDDPYFRSSEAGHQRIWEILRMQSHNDMEKRVIGAIEWTGKALVDDDDAKAMIQFVIAMECLLQIDQRSIITPSITSQISEAAAFILGRDYESRLKIELRVKRLYANRSAHVHAGTRDADPQDLNDALVYAKLLIHAFLVRPQLIAMTKANELLPFIQKMKYE